MINSTSRLMHALGVPAFLALITGSSSLYVVALSARGALAVGLSLLLVLSAGCGPVAANSLDEFAGDFVRSLVAALLL